ncbi:uncharacterized protein N7477_005654 [Penicillium maclennaniae]|uniref:uncharacterized protein n=1 Tax=Penicillium maclennaniae TaxID=1343394 RepID=UPI002541F2E8|nr:uncharacterized protein N7477_005654 [Penicillium maclennaniae]KAJ5670291.1 hypothetical protein N7477_005654 [Penicillium maclennaniae]
MEYYHPVFDLAKDVGSDASYFEPLTAGAVATMRMLYDPAQPKDEDDKLNRGIGAHTDFGCMTLMLQGKMNGLQVLDPPSGQWLDVKPTLGAYVVNLGDLFTRFPLPLLGVLLPY